ncbi:sperm-specific sodium:proton exchanger-like [Rhopilema esculentum]|uniref:sperm-specific sodium:proton exchanger-like n=1 Tax=Rhopilema esculentum TaxID=499914 RepID=UPI0031D40C81
MHFFKDYWNLLDLFIVFLSAVDIVLDIVAAGSMGGFSPSVLKVAKIFRVLRMGRVLKLIKSLIPKLIDLVNDRINKQLSFGYDIGKGFVIAEEDVMKMIDQLVVDEKIMKDLKMRSEKNRLDIIRSLGLLQREHPGIAISVKTRQGTRSVLNNALDTLAQLRSNGVMDKSEALKLEMLIQERMKRQLNAPSYIAPKKPESLLRGLPWLRVMTEETVSFIIEQAEMISYEFGDVMLRQGEPTDGVYLIVSGMVKLVGVSMAAAQTRVHSYVDSDLNISTDYLCAGNVIGEMGLLTGGMRNASVVCETAVQVYYISADKMYQALKRFPGLEDSLWRVCGIRIALPILMDQAAYKVLNPI